MKKIGMFLVVLGLAACNEGTNKSEDSSGTEISTPQVTDSSAIGRDTAGSGQGADTTRPRSNTRDN